MRTQKQIVLDLLTERGERGVSAREAIYDLRITRLAAIIFDLRQDGFTIRSETKKGETARYYLTAASGQHARNVRHCGNCGHIYRRHVAGMKCMDYVAPEISGIECTCQKFTEED